MTTETSSRNKRTFEVICEDGAFSFVIWHMTRSTKSGTKIDLHVKGFAGYWVADTAAREAMQANGWNR